MSVLNTKPQLKSKTIQAWDQKLTRVKADRADRIKVIQHECNHLEVAECDHLGSGFPPIRLCLNCGMSEEGWGPGYLILKAEPPTRMSRNVIYELRHGLMLRDQHKGPLLRKEVTIHDLIDGKDYQYEME